jgi:hypothetical protein
LIDMIRTTGAVEWAGLVLGREAEPKEMAAATLKVRPRTSRDEAAAGPEKMATHRGIAGGEHFGPARIAQIRRA